MDFGDDHFMKKALQEAISAFEKDEVPVGSVVVCAGKIIAKTHNLTELLKDVTAHAEVQAIGSASSFLGGKYLKQCTMYVTLEPCVMCAGALYWSQLGRLVFGACDPKRGFLSAGIKLHPKTQVKGPLLPEVSQELLRRFFNNKREL